MHQWANQSVGPIIEISDPPPPNYETGILAFKIPIPFDIETTLSDRFYWQVVLQYFSSTAPPVASLYCNLVTISRQTLFCPEKTSHWNESLSYVFTLFKNCFSHPSDHCRLNSLSYNLRLHNFKWRYSGTIISLFETLFEYSHHVQRSNAFLFPSF